MKKIGKLLTLCLLMLCLTSPLYASFGGLVFDINNFIQSVKGYIDSGKEFVQQQLTWVEEIKRWEEQFRQIQHYYEQYKSIFDNINWTDPSSIINGFNSIVSTGMSTLEILSDMEDELNDLYNKYEDLLKDTKTEEEQMENEFQTVLTSELQKAGVDEMVPYLERLKREKIAYENIEKIYTTKKNNAKENTETERNNYKELIEKRYGTNTDKKDESLEYFYTFSKVAASDRVVMGNKKDGEYIEKNNVLSFYSKETQKKLLNSLKLQGKNDFYRYYLDDPVKYCYITEKELSNAVITKNIINTKKNVPIKNIEYYSIGAKKALIDGALTGMTANINNMIYVNSNEEMSNKQREDLLNLNKSYDTIRNNLKEQVKKYEQLIDIHTRDVIQRQELIDTKILIELGYANIEQQVQNYCDKLDKMIQEEQKRVGK